MILPAGFIGIGVIALHLKHGSRLLTLDLHNAIKGDSLSLDKLKGVRQLAACLEENHCLEELNISRCDLSDECGEVRRQRKSA